MTSFIGRKNDLEALKNQLNARSARFIVIKSTRSNWWGSSIFGRN